MALALSSIESSCGNDSKATLSIFGSLFGLGWPFALRHVNQPDRFVSTEPRTENAKSVKHEDSAS